MRTRARMIIRTLGCAALTAVSSSAALAQCAMCRAAVASSADSAARASGMNLAVMVLLIPPLAMFCAFFVAAKFDENSGANEYHDSGVRCPDGCFVFCGAGPMRHV